MKVKVTSESPATSAVQVKVSFFQQLKIALTKPRGKVVEGATPFDVTEQSVTKMPMFFRITLEEQMLFAKRLSILLKAGIPIGQSLEMMYKQTTNGSTKLVLKDMIGGVQHGQYLHGKMEKYRKQFGDFAVNIIRVGEISGTLHENLTYLAEELKKKKELRRKVISALVYPAFIVAATVGITILLIVYVFPKILPVLQTFKGKLPITTRTLIFLSHLLITKGWVIALVIAAAVVVSMFAYKKSRQLRLLLDFVVLKIPVIGNLLKGYYMANFCRTLGLLLKSDVRIVEAATVTARTSTNLAYRDSLMVLSENLTRGEKLSDFFESSPNLYPAIVSQMITVGENTGKLSDILMYLADIYEQEVEETTRNLSTAIEPILMVFMGVLVGFIAMSIITPIYSLTQNLSR